LNTDRTEKIEENRSKEKQKNRKTEELSKFEMAER
jgi:hypothetical protein